MPIDNTLEFNAQDELGVNIQDVIEHTASAHIQYHTASNNYSSSAGATVGQAYATSQYRKIYHQGRGPPKPAGRRGRLLGAPGRTERRQLH